MELDRRKMKILGAIVSEYIRTGEPVGSKRVAQLLDTQVSPATCRNENVPAVRLGAAGAAAHIGGENPVPFGVSGLPRQAVDL